MHIPQGENAGAELGGWLAITVDDAGLIGGLLDALCRGRQRGAGRGAVLDPGPRARVAASLCYNLRADAWGFSLSVGGGAQQEPGDMQATESEARLEFETLRDLVLHYGARRGWYTQRRIAVMCGHDESALSRFLNGEQDLGARRTHALFCAVGVPVERYDLAYALLGRAQEQSKQSREARSDRVAVGDPTRRLLRLAPQRRSAGPVMQHTGHDGGWQRSRPSAVLEPAWDAAPPGGLWLEQVASYDDIPAAAVVALFAAGAYSGVRIAEFFGR